MRELLRSLRCGLFGHNWSAWIAVVPVHTIVDGVTTYTATPTRFVRGCERRHLQWRGSEMTPGLTYISVDPVFEVRHA